MSAPKYQLASFSRPGSDVQESKLVHGLKNYFAMQRDIVYWDYRLDPLHLAIRRWGTVVQRSIDALLFLALISNILVLFRMGLLVDFESLSWLNLIFVSGGSLAGTFWMLTIFNTYFVARIMRHSLSKKGTIDFSEHTGAHVRKTNIAEVMSQKLVVVYDQVWREVLATQQFPIRPLQLARALLADTDIQMVLARLGITYNDVISQLDRQIAYYAPMKNEGTISQEVEDIMLNAYLLAYDSRAPQVRTTDVFLATVRTDQKLQEILYDFNIDMDKVENVLQWVNFNNELIRRYRHYRAKSLYKPKGAVNRSYTAAATPFLDQFSTDLTQFARAGQLSLSVAREREIEEMYRIMEAGKSVVLVGENGVGKFNIIEGLANRMVAEEVPAILQDKRLVSLSLPFLVAGATQTGEVEERLLLVIQEIHRSGNIILVIEDIHNLVGVSSTGTENIDLSEVLAQEIQSRGLWVIATSSQQELTEYIERGALSGVLERITVPEPEKNQAIQILEANVGRIEAQHRVFFTYEALEQMVKLSERYLHDQHLPAKAINIMNEAGSWVAQRENKLITGEDIAELISRKTNIPLTKVTQQESDTLMNLEQIMHQRIIGQDAAVKLVVSALRRARAELRDENRPIVNLLFLGPTGVGKTELAKTVAQSYFKDEHAMVRLDMSEYQNQDSIARLLGAPGSKQGGQLTEAIRKNPFTLLLLDEIEKAHPDILNIFLQVMDDGRLTDSMGRTIDFTNVILIATSNAQAQYIQDEVENQTSVEEIKDALVRDKLRDNFRPEFLNRFDGVVVFKPLTEDEIFQIAGLLLAKVAQRLESKGITLEVTPEAQKELAMAGFDPIFGARPLRRVIQEKVEEALANFLLTGEINRRDVVVLKPGGQLEVKKAQQL